MPRTAPASAAVKLPLERARAFWHRRQGLAEPGKGTIEEFLAATSWPRTLGGVDVYLAVRARMPGMRREEMDEAVAQSRIQVIPAVRGCIYVVPRPQVPLVLRIAEDQARKRMEREMEKVGVKLSELADEGLGGAEGARARDHVRIAALLRGQLPHVPRRARAAHRSEAPQAPGVEVG